jgi:hypothetical protein
MNPNTLDPESLRRLFQQPEAGSTRVIALAVSTIFLLAVLNLVRRGRLKEEYTPIWTLVALAIMVLSIWFDAVRFVMRMVGAWTESSTLYFFGELFLLVLCLNYAVRLSGLSVQVKVLAQEVSMLREALAAREDDPRRDG